ncbi:MAG: hypothetical protein JWM74_870 [Myxococcaceae bacterium]|nr:hypothetical protein [Myxococcaceae bacterium]
MNDETFRGLVDANGFLKAPGDLTTLGLARAFLVFAQRDDARLEIHFWQQQARRFFDTELGLTIEKAYDQLDAMPSIDAARVVVSSPKNAVEATLLCAARPSTPADLALAESIEARHGYTGLAMLAKRCKTVWLVSAPAGSDRAALLLSAIVASVVLGPIVSPAHDELYGVKTARLKLESSAPGHPAP